MKKFDAIIIGSGQAGTPLSKKLAKAGFKTALIEKRWIGGTCINDGCTPTKTMIASAKMASLAAHSQELGIDIPFYNVDLPAIIQRKNEVVQQFRNASQKGLETTDNLEIIYGDACFTGTKILQVIKPDGEQLALTAEHVFINTGAYTYIPDIEGLSKIPYLTSTTLLDIEEIPEHLLIIGTGYIGLEFGHMFLRFGSRVTMIEPFERLLKKEDSDVAECLENILTADGIVFHKKAKATKFADLKEHISVTIDKEGVKEDILCSHVLIAVGRRPATDHLGLEKTGIALNDKKYIVVDDYLETSQPGIYAMGDVKGGPAFTHISYNDHLIVLKNVLNKEKVSKKGRLEPYCMFTDPQLGRIGLTETEAKNQGLHIKVAILPMENVARAIETGNTRGMMKVVVDEDTKQILGAAIIGTEGGEIMSVLQLAMMGRITYETIRETIFAHPLYAESLNNLFMMLDK